VCSGDSSAISRFGVFVKAYESVNIGNVFVMDKQTCITEIGNKTKGSTNLIGKLYLSNSTGSTEVSYLSNGIQFTKKDSSNDKVIIPYGTDLTNYNKDTFFQSIIDHTIINSPNGNLFQTITSNEKYSTTMKTLVGDDIFPKTTNTFYYTSYIKNNVPEVIDNIHKNLIQYFYTNSYIPIILISVSNSILASPQLKIRIL
jgi:hypothetical protein